MLVVLIVVNLLFQLGRSNGLGLIGLCMDLLKSLLRKCEEPEDIEEKLEKHGESELFVDFNPAMGELMKEQVFPQTFLFCFDKVHECNYLNSKHKCAP